MVYKKTQPVSEMKSIVSVKVMMALKYMYVFSLAFLVRAIQRCTLCCCIIHILTDFFFCYLSQGLTEEDLTNYQLQSSKSREIVRLERYYSWTDGLEAALCKHQSRQKFHEVALKRCMRSQKQIHKTFPKASRNQRKRAFNKFQNEHRSLKNILSKQKEGSGEFLSYQSPHKIGQDYIEGSNTTFIFYI